MGVGLVRSLQPPDILWIHWRVYNSIANTKQAGTLSTPFWCLCQKLSLSPLYFNKTLSHKSSEWSSLVTCPGLNSSPLKAKNPSIFHGSATTFCNHYLFFKNLILQPQILISQGRSLWLPLTLCLTLLKLIDNNPSSQSLPLPATTPRVHSLVMPSTTSSLYPYSTLSRKKPMTLI